LKSHVLLDVPLIAAGRSNITPEMKQSSFLNLTETATDVTDP
tara:strand:- start:299 stop:424 length:126 start_codon:yes stop_codon:yes gene_type:complete